MSDAPETISLLPDDGWSWMEGRSVYEPNAIEYTLTDHCATLIAAEREALAAVIEELEAKLVKAVARAEVADETLDKAIDASRVLIAKMKDRTDDQWRREIRGKANRGEKDE